MRGKQSLIIVIVIFVLGIGGLCAWSYTQLSHLGKEPFDSPQGLIAQIETTNAAIRKADDEIALIPIKQKELEQLNADKEDANQLLPKAKDPAKLIGFITAMADEANVKLVSIVSKIGGKPTSRSRRKKKSGPSFEEWIYPISFSGTYDQIGVFINKLEEFEITGEDGRQEKRFFAIKDLSISAANDGMAEDGVLHSGSLTTVTYRYLGDEGAKKKPVRR